MRYLLFLLIICYSMNLATQDINVDDYLVGDDNRPKVLLVGTFHFGYPGLDTHKTADQYKLDILSEERQRELRELLDYIKLFQPTMIMVESGWNTGYLMNRMRRWQKGEEELKRNERDQIGIRLAHELGLDTIYGIDAYSLSQQFMRSKDSTTFKALFSDIFESKEERASVYEDRYWDWYDKEDSLAYEMPLLDFFKFQNSEQVIDRGHGHYVLDDNYDDYDSVDGWLLLGWYSRNLRIYKNFQRIKKKSNDRVLILIGAGHGSILKQQLSSSPEYELVPFNSLGGM